MKYTLSVLVENQPGVLSKVAGLFARRGFNIDSLAVGVTEHPEISRMTIVVNGDEYIVEQVEKQLNKVIPVIKVKVLQPEAFISRELSLIKVNCNTKQRLEIMQIAQLMNAGIVDVTTNSLTLQLAARRRKPRRASRCCIRSASRRSAARVPSRWKKAPASPPPLARNKSVKGPTPPGHPHGVSFFNKKNAARQGGKSYA